MKVKTINKIITSKLNDWLEVIALTDKILSDKVKDNLLLSGGSITSLFLNQEVNDYDIYIKDMNVLIQLAKFYTNNEVLDGRKRNHYIKDRFPKYDENQSFIYGNNYAPEELVRLKNLKPDQVKLDIPSEGIRLDILNTTIETPQKYVPVFLSQNAISLTDNIQIVLRFSGTSEEIHKNFDFIHATNYFTFNEGLVTNIKALQCILTKELKYQGSLYPLTSIIRVKKFIGRGWSITAGELVKMMFQISELNLKDPEVLEEQLIGIDIAYFSKLIEVLRGVDPDKLTSSYFNTIVDKVFNEFDEKEEV